MKAVRVPWYPTRPLIILMPFDALPSCDTESYFAPGDLEPCQKKEKKKPTQRTGIPLRDFSLVTRIPLDNLTG